MRQKILRDYPELLESRYLQRLEQGRDGKSAFNRLQAAEHDDGIRLALERKGRVCVQI